MQNIAMRSVLHFCAAATLAGTAVSPAAGDSVGGRQSTRPQASENTMQQHPYVGMWVTDDGRVRHQLLSNGRYDEARGNRESAYRGRYEVVGSHIEYWDDTGFTADGDFVDGNTLHHGGMVLRRK
ncbi:Atu4866 domain-containing protein [Rhizobium croatiense]|uniref:Atu4866 domain-containing protein n=1 Tax=Rhizobium croatiense TaxID=2867516 RepID=A0ABS7M2F6_9HYPH|nr:Atu4866 domain-containing protein [Rhizobium croatiense]MBY4631017.1 Atu4866 domain-containing protein [Rhizobium croatiense]